MGGRIYDPLAGRFLTPDPIMQAPYWSQGQNRYSYVFNDPINATDPSGFSSQHINEGISGTTSVAYLPSAISIAALAKGAGVTAGAIGASLAGGALNVGISLATNPFSGSKGGSYQVPSGSAAATSSGGGANAPVAVAQNRPPVPAVQERADQLQQRLDEMPDERVANRLIFWANNLLNRYGPKAIESGKRAYDAAKPHVQRGAQRAAEVARQLFGNGNVPKAGGVPFKGFQDWGRPLWGRNLEGAQKALESMTPEVAKTIDPGKARQALEFYKQAAASGRGGETAGARVQLMERILELRK